MAVYSPLLVTSSSVCKNPNCSETQETSKTVVWHTDGFMHPMHYTCALSAIRNNKCGICSAEVDVESLLELGKKLSPIGDLVDVSLDGEIAKRIAEEDLSKSQMLQDDKQVQDDEAFARALLDQELAEWKLDETD